MKKNVSFVPMDSILAQWLRDKLILQPPDTECGQKLLIGISELLSGETAALMLGITDSTYPFPGIIDDGIFAGDLAVYPRSRKVLSQGTEVSLTPKEFDILYFLLQNRGEVFTKEQIYQAVWEEDFLLADSNIMAFIRKLRKKIEKTPDSPEYILTIWGIGYKFNDDI